MTSETTTDIFKLLEREIRAHGPIVVWTGDGEFPGCASGLRGLAFNGRTLEEAVRSCLGITPREDKPVRDPRLDPRPGDVLRKGETTVTEGETK